MELSGSDSSQNRILRRGSAPLPPHVWNDLPAHRDTFVSALRAALAAAGISGKSVIACMPRRLVTVRFARLPSAPPEQMKQMVTFEAQQYILFSLDEVSLDYHALTGPLPGFGSSDGEDLETVLLAAARRSLINELLAIFDKAGLELRQLSVSALALAEHARDVLEPTALIDIQPGSMDVAVVADGQLLFTRATALDLEGISPDVAQRKLDEEVARSFTAYQNEYRSKIIGHVFLSGSSATVKDAGRLERSLSSILEMPVSRLHNRLITANDPDLIGYATASGLALQTQSSALAPISLVPDERAERQARQASRLRQQVSVLGAAAVLIGAIWQANAMVKNSAADAVRTLAANKKLKSSKSILDTVQKKHDKLASFDAELEKGLDRKHGAVDVVTALHAALPNSSDLWLTQLSYVHGGLLTLRGEARNSTAPTELAIALQGSGAFRDVKLVYMGDAQETNLVATAPPKADAKKDSTPLPNFGDGGMQMGGMQGFTPSGGAPGFPTGGGSAGFQGGAQPGAGNPAGGFTAPGGGGFTPGGGGFTPGGGGFTPGRQPNIITPGQPPTGIPSTVTPGAFQIPAGRNVILPDAPGPAVTGEGTTPGPRRRQRANRMSSRFGGTATGADTVASTGTKPAVTTTASVSSNNTSRRSRVIQRPGVGGKVTRTSFIITCHVNQSSVDLLMGLNLTSKKSDQSAGPAANKARKRVVGEGETDDSGDNDAD